MDRLNQYRPLIERLLGEQLEFVADDKQVDTVSIVDKTRENYLLVEIGWQHPRRIYNVVFHVRLKEGKIWVEQDWTREGIAHELISAGVPAELIVYGYQSPEIRPYIHPELSH